MRKFGNLMIEIQTNMFYFLFLRIPFLITFVSSIYSPQSPGAAIWSPNEPESISSSVSKSEYHQENVQEKSSEKPDWRIVGGHECSEKDFTFIVSLRLGFSMHHFCAGTLLTTRFVLSAAHCFMQISVKKDNLMVVVDEFNELISNVQLFRVESIMIHEKFDNKTIMNDISLVYLGRDVELRKGRVEVVKLPTQPLPDDLSETCDPQSFNIAGWGETKPHGVEEKLSQSEAEPRLQCVNLPYITNDECLKYAKEASNKEVLCTLQAEGGKDACVGDSGGPLMCGGVQYGIISWGRGCGVPGSPGFYIRVDRYLDFINEKLGSKELKSFATNELLEISFSTILSICFVLVKFLN